MQWQDEAIILGVKRHGETSVIAEVMTSARGRHLGMVRGGRSRSMQPVLQAGNRVDVTWRARLDDHLGEYRVEPLQFARRATDGNGDSRVRRTGHGSAAAALAGARSAPASLSRPRCHSRQPLRPADAGELFVRFELAVLNDLGFGLDLTECAATGIRSDLVYVSPKTGRAVSRAAGAPYAQRMLALPPFLGEAHAPSADCQSLSAAFRLTNHFL